MHADGITAVRLTFDDGPSVWTPPILDLLFDHDIQATFSSSVSESPTTKTP